MTADDARNRRDDETADWPITAPPNAASGDDGEATTMIGSDGEATQPAGLTPPLPPPTHQGPPTFQPRYGGPPPRHWSSGPAGPRPPTGAHPGAAPEWTSHPGHPPQQGFSPQPGHLPLLSAGNPRPPGNRKWTLVAATLAVAIVAAGVAVLVTRRSTDTTAKPATASPTSAMPVPSTAPTPVSVDPARLPQMLLPADVLSSTLAGPGLVPGDVQSNADFATDSIVDPPTCTSTWGPGKTWTYQLSGFIGMARQLVTEQPTPNHAVVQAVLAFPDHTAAKKSFDAQVTSWGECQSQTITSHVGGGSQDQTAVIGAVAEVDGMATLPTTPDLGLPGVTCERALTVAGNVVVDVRSCSPNVGDTAGTIARDISARITTGR